MAKDGTPLIKLRSDLRNLKFSEFGANPYVQHDIPGYREDGRKTNQLNARTNDLERFTKILTSKPGFKFAGNQALLAQTNTLNNLKKAGKAGGLKGLGKAILDKAKSTVIDTAKATTSILAQVPVNGTGTHFIRGFNGGQYLREGGEPTSGLGQFLSNTLNIGGGLSGAPKALSGDTIILDNEGQEGYAPAAESQLTELNSRFDLQADVASNPVNYLREDLKDIGAKIKGIFSKNKKDATAGIPKNLGSIFKLNPSNLGQENFRTEKAAEEPEEIQSELKRGDNPPSHINKLGSENLLATEDKGVSGRDIIKGLQSQKREDPSNTRNARIIYDNYSPNNEFNNFQTIDNLRDRKSVHTPDELLKYQLKDGQTYTQSPLYIQTKYKLGDHGNVDKTKVRPDGVNVLDVTTSKIFGDIIPFEFHVFSRHILNEEVKGDSKFLYFRAFLDDLSDNFTGDWAGTKYVGRAEDFYTYQGFKRDLSFSFKIAALSKRELYPLYNKINNLVATTAPSYNENGQFMKGTMVKITIGDYLDRVAGFISSVNLTWDKSYPWELDVDQLGTQKLPHILNVSVNFTPIHDFNVKSDIDVKQGEVYIGRKVFAEGEEEEVVAPPKRETDFFYTNGFTYEYDKKTKKVIAVNGQPTNYVNGGFAYKENGEQAVITRVDGTDSTF